MYIEELIIRGYGKLSSFMLAPARGLNVLYGPAGAGKTTICNCLRDMLLGPGHWDGAEAGPRAPFARPWSGDMFQARVRYSLGDDIFTVQRDFDNMVTRARNDRTASEVPMTDARAAAPGVLPLRLAERVTSDDPSTPAVDAAQQRLHEARAREEAAEREAAAWTWRFNKALALDFEGRLNKAQEIALDLETLRPQLAQHERFATLQRTDRDSVIADTARLRTVEKEVEETSRALEGLQSGRRDIGTRLRRFEAFFSVTAEDLETVKNLDLSEGPSNTQVEEKERNLDGFVTKEADINKRLQEVASRFANVESDDDFEQRVSEHEREVSRSELLTAKVMERDRNQEKMDVYNNTSHRYLAFFLLCVLVAVMCVVSAFLPGIDKHEQLICYIAGGLMVVLGFGVIVVKKTRVDRPRIELASENTRIVAEMDALQKSIDVSREQLRIILDSAGVQTIKELRTLYREYRSLQRDAETVKAYRMTLERDLEVTRQATTTKKIEVPKVLIACGLVGEGDNLSPRIVADFFEAYHKFRALQQEEDSLKKRLAQAQTDLTQKTEERDNVQASRARTLQGMGLQSETEMEEAFSLKRVFDSAQSQIEVLEEKLRSVLHGKTLEEAARQLEETTAALATLEKERPELAQLEASADMLEEYRARLSEANQLVAKVSGEIAAIQGAQNVSADTDESTDGLAGVSAERLERRVGEVWSHLTGRAAEVRIREASGRLQLESRASDSLPWQPAFTLGSLDARLFDIVLAGEGTRAAGAAMPPLFLDNPFTLLDDGVKERLVEWLLELSGSVQIFVTLSSIEARDYLRRLIQQRGIALNDTRQGEVDVTALGAPQSSASVPIAPEAISAGSETASTGSGPPSASASGFPAVGTPG